MQRQLANGLMLRTLSEGFASDCEQLPQFYAAVNGEGEPAWIADALDAWTQDLINDHPLTSHDDIFVAVDPAHEDRIVSATLLIPQTWYYEEIPIGVGRPELVGTLSEYRGRGLVRALFEEVHARSADLGHQLQAITGIPYFYRQFGYTMALDLGHCATFPLHVPGDPPPDYTPAYTLRPATLDDIPDLARWHEAMRLDRVVTEMRTPELWRYELIGRRARSLCARHYLIILNATGEGVGYLEIGATTDNQQMIYCPAYVVGDQASYLATFDDVMRGVKQWAEQMFGKCQPLLLFTAGHHPALYTLVGRAFGGAYPQLPYKWYLRVADPVAFFRLIQPVLERRLEGSGAHRYTGNLKIGFYDLTGVALQFEAGKIVNVMPLQGKDGYTVSFPWHLFWNIVFGDQSAAELRGVLPDVDTGGGKGMVLLNSLFPKKQSWLRGLA